MQAAGGCWEMAPPPMLLSCSKSRAANGSTASMAGLQVAAAYAVRVTGWQQGAGSPHESSMAVERIRPAGRKQITVRNFFTREGALPLKTFRMNGGVAELFTHSDQPDPRPYEVKGFKTISNRNWCWGFYPLCTAAPQGMEGRLIPLRCSPTPPGAHPQAGCGAPKECSLTLYLTNALTLSLPF